MSGPQYMPLYVGDYLRDTLHLTAEQHGAYLLLLMACWTLGALPDDERKLARIAKLSTKKWRHFAFNFESFFEKKNDGLWHQKRIDRERQHVENVRAARSKSGSKGVANRWHARTRVLPIANDSKPEPELEPEIPSSLRSEEILLPQTPPSGREGRRGRGVVKKSPRTVQAEAFLHAALSPSRNC